MTIRAIVSTVRTLINDYSRTQSYTDYYLYSLFIQKRSVLMTRRLKKNETINIQNYSTYCYPLTLVNANTCNTIVPLDCELRRTVVKLPTYITGKNGSMFDVRNLENIKISQMMPYEANIIQYNDIKKKSFHYFIDNNYLYICGNKDIEVVKIAGLVEDPTKIDTSITQCNNIFDLDIPIDLETLDVVNQMIIEAVAVSEKLPDDMTNDTNNLIKGI